MGAAQYNPQAAARGAPRVAAVRSRSDAFGEGARAQSDRAGSLFTRRSMLVLLLCLVDVNNLDGDLML